MLFSDQQQASLPGFQATDLVIVSNSFGEMVAILLFDAKCQIFDELEFATVSKRRRDVFVTAQRILSVQLNTRELSMVREILVKMRLVLIRLAQQNNKQN